MNYENRIKRILHDLNIKARIKGCKYWIEATNYVLKNKLKAYSMTKEIYIVVAKKFDTTAARVERALRHAIEDKQEKINKYFGVNYRITNSGFLALMVDKVKNGGVLMEQMVCSCGQVLKKGDKYYEFNNEIWCDNCIDQYLREEERVVGEDE